MIIGAGGDAAHDGLPVLIVTGLKQEAQIAAGPGLTVVCSSSNPVQLREMMTTFDPASVRGIVSFGVAGGLDPALRSGDIMIATEVVTASERWSTVAALSDNSFHCHSAARIGSCRAFWWASRKSCLGKSARRRCARPQAPLRSIWKATSLRATHPVTIFRSPLCA